MQQIIGIDFGTTNSVVAMLAPDGSVQSKQFHAGDRHFDVFRSLLCFWSEIQFGRHQLRHEAGPAAIEAYLEDPIESRLIMSMKTYLAQRSFTQTRVFGKIFRMEEMVALFLRALIGDDPADVHIVAGRPVKFAGEFADDDFGETRLRGAFSAAGFPEVNIAYEPEAAGYQFTRSLTTSVTVLIGDFGGGTSDFSVIRFTPYGIKPINSLSHTGIGIAGDTFDYRIMDHAVSPLLGKGDTYNVMGTDLPVPIQYYAGFSRWHRLSLMRSPRILRDIEDVARTSQHPDRLRHLISLIKDELGYPLYQAVGAVKAQLSLEKSAQLRFQHKSFVIDRTISRDEFEAWITPDLTALAETIDNAIALAKISPNEIDRVFLTGGTSFVPAVRRLFSSRFGQEKISSGKEFVSVAEGLALIGRDRIGQK